MSKHTYIGVTIGPIVETIELARKTGELWGSSYIFSYIMKNIIKKILDKHKSTNIQERFIIPYVEDDVFKARHEVGLFHDRFIFKSLKNEFESLNEIIDEVKCEFAENVYSELYEYHKQNNKNQIIEYIKNYFQIYSLEVELAEDENAIIEINKYLDVIELNKKPIGVELHNYLKCFLKNEIIKKSFLAKDGFVDVIKVYRSLANIAMTDLGSNNFKELEEDELIEKFEGQRIKHHNYVAIVQVDGDNVGKVIKELKEKCDFRHFSKNLYKYAIDAVGKIKEYDGFPLYAGGDDLLFIAPVINNRGKCKNIFSLVNILSKLFEEKFKDEFKVSDDVKTPTLSFGISIVHYKYPLYEAINGSRCLLFEKAKNHEYVYDKYVCEGKEHEKKYKKNAIAFNVIKHSGQMFGITINKELKSYEIFIKIIEDECKIKKNEIDGFVNNLRDISNKILNDKKILLSIKNDKNRIKNYFKNNFDEDYHKINEVNNCLKNVEKLFLQISKEYQFEESQDCVDILYSYLRVIRFLGEKENDYEC